MTSLVADLVVAAAAGDILLLEQLLSCGADPSADDNAAVCAAAENGHGNVVERLLQDVRVDPSARQNFAIRCAAQRGHLAVVERLLQ